jgi:hypothetical protein
MHVTARVGLLSLPADLLARHVFSPHNVDPLTIAIGRLVCRNLKRSLDAPYAALGQSFSLFGTIGKSGSRSLLEWCLPGVGPHIRSMLLRTAAGVACARGDLSLLQWVLEQQDKCGARGILRSSNDEGALLAVVRGVGFAGCLTWRLLLAYRLPPEDIWK